MRIATPAFFCFPFVCNIFLYPLTFSLYVFRSEVGCTGSMYMGLVVESIQPVCVFWLEHLIHIHLKQLLIYVPIVIFLIVWGWFCRSFFLLLYFFNICCKAGFVILNSLNFCLSKKHFISPWVLTEILTGYSNLGCRFFPFSTLNVSCHSLLACWVSAERSAVKCMGFPLYVTCCFSLAVFNILSLCLVFVSLISMCLGMFLRGFILYGTLCASWTWFIISFSMLEKFSTIISSKIFYPFLLPLCPQVRSLCLCLHCCHEDSYCL